MEHKKSIFQFEDSKGVGGQLPYTKTENPTKTQAKEIIAAAKKLNKDRDKRDKQINKILDGTK